MSSAAAAAALSPSEFVFREWAKQYYAELSRKSDDRRFSEVRSPVQQETLNQILRRVYALEPAIYTLGTFQYALIQVLKVWQEHGKADDFDKAGMIAAVLQKTQEAEESNRQVERAALALGRGPSLPLDGSSRPSIPVPRYHPPTAARMWMGPLSSSKVRNIKLRSLRGNSLRGKSAARNDTLKRPLLKYQSMIEPTPLELVDIADIFRQASIDAMNYKFYRDHIGLTLKNSNRLIGLMAALYKLNTTESMALYERIKYGNEDDLVNVVVNNEDFDNTTESHNAYVEDLYWKAFPTIQKLNALLRTVDVITGENVKGGRRRTHKRHPKKRHNKRKTQSKRH